MTETDRILDGAEDLQKKMHEFIDEMRNNERTKALSYDLLKDMFFLVAISSLQEEIRALKTSTDDMIYLN